MRTQYGMSDRHGNTVKGYSLPAMVKRLCGHQAKIESGLDHNGNPLMNQLKVSGGRLDSVSFLSVWVDCSDITEAPAPKGAWIMEKEIKYCGIITLNGEQFDTLHDSGKGMLVFRNSQKTVRVCKKSTSFVGSSFTNTDRTYEGPAPTAKDTLKNYLNATAYRKIRFQRGTDKTAGLIVTETKFREGIGRLPETEYLAGIGSLSRLFPASECLKMQFFQFSPAFDTWEKAFAFNMDGAGVTSKQVNP